MTIRPIPVNSGGGLDVENIIGRDGFRDEMLAALDRRSVVLTGERRMGKTSVAKLVERASPRDGWTTVRLSVEGYRSIDELTQSLLWSLERFENPLQRTARGLLNRLSFNVGGVGVEPAQSRLLFEDVVTAAVAETDSRLLLILDELPLFARALNQRDPAGDEGTAALHLLRRLRETHAGLRMLCLGSIGFHHVTRDASGVLNDTVRLRLDPLPCGDGGDAELLARCLLRGADLPDHDEAETARAIAACVEGVPYYMHKIVEAAERLSLSGTLDSAAIDEIVTTAITTSDDPWDLRHYRDRIPVYYGEQAPLARATLDVLASGAPLDLDGIVNLVRLDRELEAVARDDVRDVLERLEDDHYLVRDGENRTFAFAIVRRAWVRLRR
ncbi:P-loop NTPase family protein [Conexibacter woesei]|uniref:ATP-binding protein n=1 Tax=Conexibacter woesei TaxID=191495 RepID=UPI0011D188FC|nr:ATP-binding protein [Conexibacter woesei]